MCFIGESEFVALTVQPESLPRYCNNRNSVQRLSERLATMDKASDKLVALKYPVVYIGGEVTEQNEMSITQQHGKGSDGSEIKRRKIISDDMDVDVLTAVHKESVYLYDRKQESEKGNAL